MQNVEKSGGCTIFYVDEDRCEAIYVISPFPAALTLCGHDDDDFGDLFQNFSPKSISLINLQP